VCQEGVWPVTFNAKLVNSKPFYVLPVEIGLPWSHQNVFHLPMSTLKLRSLLVLPSLAKQEVTEDLFQNGSSIMLIVIGNQEADK